MFSAEEVNQQATDLLKKLNDHHPLEGAPQEEYIVAFKKIHQAEIDVLFSLANFRMLTKENMRSLLKAFSTPPKAIEPAGLLDRLRYQPTKSAPGSTANQEFSL